MSELMDELVTRLARGEPMEVAERERLKRALGETPRLREAFEAQQSLSHRLRGLSRELRCLRAPDASDAVLAKVEFPPPERTAGRSARRTGWVVAATAAAIVILIGLVDNADDLASRYGEPALEFERRATSAQNVDDYFDEFVPLGRSPAAPGATAYSIVRVRLPMSSMDMASDYPASQVTVEADVILGEDGIAQGIRFAHADVIAPSDGVWGGE